MSNAFDAQGIREYRLPGEVDCPSGWGGAGLRFIGLE